MSNAVEQQIPQEENTSEPIEQAEQQNTQTPKDIAVVIRPLLKRVICNGDACRAAVFNQVLYCIAWKREQGKDFWYGSYEEVYQTLLDASWGKSKVIKELNALVKEGLLEQRRNPVKGWDQTRQYLFGEKEAKKLREKCEKEGICAHQIGFPASVVHLLKITNAFSENNNCISCKQQMQVVKSTDASVKNNKAIPKTSPKTSTETSPKNRVATIVPVVEDDSDPEEDIHKDKEEGSTNQEPMSKATEREFRLRARDWGYTDGDEVERGLDIYHRAKLGDNQFYEQIVNASVGINTMDEFFNRLCELTKAMEG